MIVPTALSRKDFRFPDGFSFPAVRTNFAEFSSRRTVFVLAMRGEGSGERKNVKVILEYLADGFSFPADGARPSSSREGAQILSTGPASTVHREENSAQILQNSLLGGRWTMFVLSVDEGVVSFVPHESRKRRPYAVEDTSSSVSDAFLGRGGRCTMVR